jgi:pimeloyl-ACP methyl ester carboxylesterase
MRPVYIFSGLGTDERVFNDIDLTGFNKIFIEWVAPQGKESIESYSQRLSLQIKLDRPVLIGLSFGGIVAMEVCKYVAVEMVILIASAKTRKEIPFYYKIAGALCLNKLVPTDLLRSSTFISSWAFGASSMSDKRLLSEILKDTDPAFLRWAINEIVHWKNKTTCSKVIHVHGRSDRILPFMFVKADIAIAKGSHFMTVNRSTELTRIIRSILEDAESKQA